MTGKSGIADLLSAARQQVPERSNESAPSGMQFRDTADYKSITNLRYKPRPHSERRALLREKHDRRSRSSCRPQVHPSRAPVIVVHANRVVPFTVQASLSAISGTVTKISAGLCAPNASGLCWPQVTAPKAIPAALAASASRISSPKDTAHPRQRVRQRAVEIEDG